jgi:hypothetical protein
MGPHFLEIANVADVIAIAMLIKVLELHPPSSQGSDSLESLKYGKAIRAPTTDVVRLTTARCLRKSMNESRNIKRMDVIPHLFSLVSVNLVEAAL